MPGLYGDGGGLYLQVGPSGSKSWILRFMLLGRARAMGLGPVHTISLAEARELALECRKLLLQGKDPIEERTTRIGKIGRKDGFSFMECANRYIGAHSTGWKNAKHAAQWHATLATYAEPVFGDRPVAEIDLGMVMRVLEPIWAKKTETASRVRGRIESVLDWAAVRGFRTGDNPARWRGHLEALLPAKTKVRKVRHHPALPHEELSAFMRELKQQAGSAPAALQFIILTAARTGEVIGASWDEVDLNKKLWVIPAERMKMSKEHRVPLTEATLALLGDRPQNLGQPLFAGAKQGSKLSNMAILQLLKRMGRSEITTHGFRSTFRDWVAEKTEFPHELAEMALAHAVGNKVEAAYRRGDMFERRRDLMEHWAATATA